MQPITRETILDRRQPAIRWSAVLAGTAVGAGLWGVLQLLGLGAGLSAIEPDEVTSGRSAFGVGALSLLAPLVATFVGGYLAAKLANTYDRKVAGAHGLVVWGLTALIGLGTTLWLAKLAAVGAVAPERHDAMVAAERMGNGLLGLAAVILLSIGTAILGALLALRRSGHRDEDAVDRRGPHTTAPYPTTPPSEPAPMPPRSGAV